MKFLLIGLILFTGIFSAVATDDKIKQAVEKGLVTQEFLNTLTGDDVPEKWKAQKSIEETDKLVTQVYKRGGVRILALTWTKDWKGDNEKNFYANVFHGGKSLAKIMHLSGHTSVQPSDEAKGYQIITVIQDDGTAKVELSNDHKGFYDVIVIHGRDTHLLEDLEYTKSALAMEHIGKPLIKALTEAIKNSPAKAAPKE